MEDSDEDYPTPGIEFSVSMATNNEANIDTSPDVDQYSSSDGSVMSVDENSITEDGNSVLEADCPQNHKDDISILYQRVSSVEVDTDIISQSQKQLDSAINLLGEAVDLLQQNNVDKAKQYCYEAYDMLNGIDDPEVVRGQLEAYSTCCDIFQKCEEHGSALECYYQAFLMRKHLEPYLIHSLEVMIYWIPFTEGQLQSESVSLIRKIKMKTDKYFEASPKQNCKRALHVYIDLNISLRNIRDHLSNPNAVVEDVRGTYLQIAKCFLLTEVYEKLCMICKKIDEQAPFNPGCSMFCEFYETWCRGLTHLHKYDVARKKAEKYLEMSINQRDIDSANCLMLEIDLHEEENIELDEDSVDSDNEYVRDSNYSIIKQQQQQADEARDNHQKKTRHRPKRQFKQQDFLLEANSWKDVEKKRTARKRHLTASSVCSQASMETEQLLSPPEGHDHSEIESDHEFDTMSRSDWFGEESSSSEDEADPIHDSTEDQYEKSLRLFEEGSDDEIDEHELLQNGIDLSDKFVDDFKRRPNKKKDSFYPEFHDREKALELYRRYPLKFKRCIVKLEAAHTATCTNLDHDDVKEIEISGRSKIGKVYNEDEVIVEILKDEREAYKGKNYIKRLDKTLDLSKMTLKIYGQIVGLIKHRHYPDIDHPVLVSILDESEFHLMRPISKIVPKLHILKKNCQNNYQVEIYKYDSQKRELNYQKIFNIKPGEIKNYIFLVAMICWEDLYPLGAVIKVIDAKDGLNSGMEILRLQHQVPTIYKRDTVQHVKWLLELDKPLINVKDREDCTNLDVFTIDPPTARDLDDALSVEEDSDGKYRVGVHIADVTCFVEKGSHVDCEAYERATTFYPGQGRNPYHMLPGPLSTRCCSLLPGETRPTISVFYTFDKDGTLQKSSTKIKRTTIKSRQKLTYREAQDAILKIETNVPKNISEKINCLFHLAKCLRTKRMGSALFYVPPQTNSDDDDDFMETREAHYLVEEFMVLSNHTVGKFLATGSRFKNCVPLRIQKPPDQELVAKWLEAHEWYVDLILKLQEIVPLPSLQRDRQISIKNAPTGRYTKILMYQHWVWKKLLTAIENRDFVTASQIIGCDELHPFSCLALDEWYEYQEKAEFKCSGDMKSRQEASHFSLGMYPYTNFTSPIRRYIDIVTHRLLHCALDNKSSCYSKEEVTDMCHHMNEVTKRAKDYQKKCLALAWGYKLKKEPVVSHGFVKSVSEKEVTVVVPGHRNLPKESKTLQLNCIGATKKPNFLEDRFTKRKILELTWSKRLYSFNGYSPIKTKDQRDNGYRVNPHNRGFFQQQKKWKHMLECLTSQQTPHGKMKKLLKIIYNDDLGNSKENIDKLLENIPSCYDTVNDVSSEVRKGDITLQNCQFSMTFNHQQVLAFQMSAASIKGVFIPQIEMFDMTNNVKFCLLHVKDPITHLERYSSSSTKDAYSSPVDYLRIWKPLVEMEAATNSVKGDTATINDVPVKFLSQYEGKFSLGKGFCDQRNIEISKVPLEEYLFNQQEKQDDENDEGITEIASPDYLCIKCPVYKEPVDKWNLQKGNIVPDNYMIWNAHAKIERTQVKKGKMDFIFKLHKNSKPVPPELMADKTNSKCSIEVIFKSSADGRIDAILQCLNKATPLAKAIAIGSEIPKLDSSHFKIGRDTEPDVLGIGLVSNNTQQYKAIETALKSSFSLIQGPPGTGKTYTGIKLVYLFNQINLKWQEMGNEKKQIIFCGPSNKSVDLVAKWMKKKLGMHCPKMVRWYGSSIEDQEFPIPGKTPTNTHGDRVKADQSLSDVSIHLLIRQLGKPYQEEIAAYDRQFRQHSGGVDYKVVKKYKSIVTKAVIEEVKHHDVIFCTTAMATNLKVLKGTKNRIFQIIVDECGMCTEPESMAAIIATRAQQVVLIGDHKQLRPIVKCSEAAKLGLEKSLFERYASRATLLTSQYRMNPTICAFPSGQFYNGRLKTKPSSMWMTDIPLRSWIHRDIPVVFCHVEGNETFLPFDTDEGNEQSCSNLQEVDHVVKIFKHLVDEELIDTDHINIMSQYNAQCTNIRKALNKEKIIQFNVNTVVASQGGEWDYVVLSLVRSLPDYRIEPKPTLGWCKQNLGFITDEHQTNVALTRARKGLIVVGNRKLLKCNEVWANFIEHYGRRGCVVDCEKFPPLPLERKKKKKSRRIQEMDEFYRNSENDQNRPE